MASTNSNIETWVRERQTKIQKLDDDELKELKKEIRKIKDRENKAKKKIQEVINWKTNKMNLDKTELTKRLGLVDEE